VLSISKIQSKSKSQLELLIGTGDWCCAQYFKDTIQKQITTKRSFSDAIKELCSVFQRYNPKANHNIRELLSRLKVVVLSISKIQSKSKSQHATLPKKLSICCAQYFKDTIQKQITTKQSRVVFPF